MPLLRRGRRNRALGREEQQSRRPRRASDRKVGGWIIRGLLIIFLLSAVVGSVITIYRSPFLKVAKVTVIGNERTDENTILDGLDLIDRNILTVDTEQIAQIVGKIPSVRRAKVSRNVPDEITITIEERQPWAVWQSGNDKFLIDEEGVVLEKTQSPGASVIIVDMDKRSLSPGSRVNPEAVELAMKLIDVLPKEMGVKAKRFEYLARGGLVVETDKGWRARFGDADDFDFKLATWKAVLAKAKQDNLKAQHVDLRFGTRPFFRP